MSNLCKVFCCCKMKYWEIRQNCCNKAILLIKGLEIYQKNFKIFWMKIKWLKVDWLTVAENTSNLLKSNTKKLNEQLINIERRQYKLAQYSRRVCIEIQGIPQDIKIINLEDTVIKIFEKIEMSINKRMIVAYHRLGKTTKTVVKFANRKDAELVLKS